MSQESVAAQAAQFWELLQRAQKLALSAQSTAFAKAAGQEFSVVDANSAGAAAMKAFAEFAQHPMELAAFQQTVWLDATKAWVDAWTGESPAVADKRFRDKTWEEDPISRGLRDAHLAVEGAVDKLLNSLPKGSKDHLSVEFYTRQFLSALSPSNFLALNPAARHRFIETEGQSVLDGFKNLLDDLEHGEGRLDISTNDKEAFVVGRDLATTPGKVVYQNDLMQLIQYEPLTETQRKRPLLFVPAWINKYYILDMRPKNSLVRYMLERGHSVFVISWVNPTKEHAEKSFEDYMRLGPLAALDAIQAATGEKRVNILGFCIGGILVTATLAWLAAREGRSDCLGDYARDDGGFHRRGRDRRLHRQGKADRAAGAHEGHRLPREPSPAGHVLDDPGERPDLVVPRHELPDGEEAAGFRSPVLELGFHAAAGGDAALVPREDLHREWPPQARPSLAGRNAHRHFQDQDALFRAGYEGGPHRAVDFGLSQRPGFSAERSVSFWAAPVTSRA